ncbi:MAG: ATP-dependent zinc metalloprotease FtsH, partial [Pseudomonadales bacterium]|nr:ATP-dependent zinc metalloprotease FtsH [Pseudomonadales bacterium]
PNKVSPEPSAWLSVIMWIVIALMTVNLVMRNDQPNDEIPYSEFKAQLRQDSIDSITLRGNEIRGSYRFTEGTEGAAGRRFTTLLPAIEDTELMPLLDNNAVVVAVQSTEYAPWVTLLINVLPWVFIIGLFLLSRQMLGKQLLPGAGGFTKSRARLAEPQDIHTRYDDIAGLQNAKADLQEVIEYLKTPEKFLRLGASIPKGILLMGPPGTGKTMLAKATAGEAGVPFFSITGSEFVEMFVGVGASRVRDMFLQARAMAPALIFIDEIDSVGRTRSGAFGNNNDEREQTLNQILAEMDGFKEEETVVVLAATNRPDVLDAALLRPGRFDRKVVLDLPQKVARQAILAVHVRGKPIASDVDLENLALGTVGFSGADLANLVNEAALLAARGDKNQLEQADFENARDKIILGDRREALFSEAEKRRTAYHEAGHALTAFHMPHGDKLRKISIIPRGKALGVTEQSPSEDMLNYSQHYLEDRLAILLGGRAAESLIFAEVSSGAADDLKQATHLAQHMIAEWGMSAVLGPVTYRETEQNFLGQEVTPPRLYSEHTAEIIDAEVTGLIKAGEMRALAVLQQHRQHLDTLAQHLLEQETLGEEEITAILATALAE